MAEWSNATDLRSVLFGGAGSNPAGDTIKKSNSNNFLPFKHVVAGSIPVTAFGWCSSVVEHVSTDF